MNRTIENTIQRTRQYWYIDGFSEMLTGLVFLLLGVVNWISGINPPSMGSAVMVGIGYPIIILGGLFAGRVWLRSMKEKITYPRTGFVKYIQPERSLRTKHAVTAFFVAFSVSIITMAVTRGLDPYWVVLGTGLIIAAFIGYMGVQVPLNRFFILAVFVVVVSIVSAAIPVPEDIQMGILLGGCGLGWIGSGLITLLFYLKHTRTENSGLEEN